jgi:two-component system OmpR family sensor kinase
VTLRTRLTLALVALTAIGLGVAALVTYHEVGSFLVKRVDQELATAAQNPNIFFSDFQGGSTSTNNVPVGTYAEFRDNDGNILRQTPPLGNLAPPALKPGAIHAGNVYSVHEPHYRIATESATYGRVSQIPGTLVVAIPMRDIDDTLQHLLLIELLVAAGVLVALALMAWWVVHLELRPLKRMGMTAGAIAGGDLSQRVEPADETTEVGRLGLALNSMLGQIEVAFAERTESETRLRRFVADASHELRTPLTSIRGYAELFRRGANTRPDDLAKTMRRIEEAAARMGVLVDDLLLLARLDQGRPLEHGPVDLTRLVAAAVDDLRATSPERPVTYEASAAVVVNGDEFRLRQVLANLLENARSHTPPSTPVEVRVTQTAEEAVVEVRDYGPGMNDEEAARAFERFWRSDPSRTRTSGGAGLGLAIVSAITEAHGGHTELDTAPGEGATFRIYLPLTGPPPAAESPATASTPAEPAESDLDVLPEVQAETT